jgi:hypothetical protein
MSGWRWAAASEIGTGHARRGAPKQDAFRCVSVPQLSALVAVVCDGAGSASHGGEGAALACRSISSAFVDCLRRFGVTPQDDEIWHSIDGARDRIATAAANRDLRPRDFATTLIAMIVTPWSQLVVHVGDGAAVGRTADGGWISLSWPDTGEYASTTYFVTDEPAPKLRIARSEHRMDACAVFSDGVETFSLNEALRQPHAPFFDPMLRSIDAALHTGRLMELSGHLADFLRSERVCARTDDDKTLILASCR